MANSGLTRVPWYYGLLWLDFLMFLHIFHGLLLYIHNQCLASSPVIAKPLRPRSGNSPSITPWWLHHASFFSSNIEEAVHPSNWIYKPSCRGSKSATFLSRIIIQSVSYLYCILGTFVWICQQGLCTASYMSGQPRYRSQPANMICILDLQSNDDLFRRCAK